MVKQQSKWYCFHKIGKVLGYFTHQNEIIVHILNKERPNHCYEENKMYLRVSTACVHWHEDFL